MNKVFFSGLMFLLIISVLVIYPAFGIKLDKSGYKGETAQMMPESGSTAPESTTSVASEINYLPVHSEFDVPAKEGLSSKFGGPKDKGVKPTETTALQPGLARDLKSETDYYCAMRWEYCDKNGDPFYPDPVDKAWKSQTDSKLYDPKVEGSQPWWNSRKIMVTNPNNGKSVVVKPVDSGPHEDITNKAIDLSEAAQKAIGVSDSDLVQISMTDDDVALGPYSSGKFAIEKIYRGDPVFPVNFIICRENEACSFQEQEANDFIRNVLFWPASTKFLSCKNKGKNKMTITMADARGVQSSPYTIEFQCTSSNLGDEWEKLDTGSLERFGAALKQGM
jgi:hypothetical protein